ncbi:MAG: hypothetical protein ACFFE4_09295, partial [Candidatus Thorarchaeota archaeon]
MEIPLEFSIIMGILITGMFIVIFYDYLPRCATLFSNKTILNLFEHFIIFWEKKDQSTIFFTNKKDLIHNVVQIFRIEEIPENIHASLNLFLKSLSEYKNMISFTYQIVQTPNVYIKEDIKISEARNTNIYFCINYSVKGILTKNKLFLLKQRIRYFNNTLKSNFIGNFHHFKISLLSGERLVNALRLYFFKVPTQPGTIEIESLNTQPYSYSVLIKSLFLCFLIIYLDFSLFVFHIPLLYVIFMNIVLVRTIIYLWWRELIFILRKNPARSSFIYLNIFPKTKFYRYRGIPDTIFLHVEDKLLVGMKMLNLAFCFQPAYSRLDKFIQVIMNQKVSFTYTCINTPLTFAMFYKESLKFLTEKTHEKLFKSNWRIQTKIDALRWLSRRSGIWQTFLTISIHEYYLCDSLTKSSINKLEQKLQEKSDNLQSAFNMNFFNYELIRLRKDKLLSGMICELMKSKDYSYYGSGLNYLIFQGKALLYLIEIVDELKKGIETRVASEFNTPLGLENYIIIGHTINTEVLEEELPFGFTKSQIRNLLVVNGISLSRELFAMKVVSELVKNNVPSLIFDFQGNWSKLIYLYKDTANEKDFLYFKLGSAFTLDPLKSDIPYDTENLDYLNYMFDAYALAFKKHQKTIDIIRNTIMRNPDLDLSSLNLELINQNPWEKNPASDTLLALFGDFTQQDLPYIHVSSPNSKETGVITFNDFIKDNRTVIIDLSVSNDFKKQIFFVFLILSKIIHYLKFVNEYQEKIIIIPHMDLFFDNFFIDRFSDYGKINKFLNPLVEKRFGVLFSANQAHYLHHNLVSFFDNIAVFNTKDSRDIAAISNVMGLQELEGIGYYSRSRNQTYQFRYLMSMKNKEAVIKRSDVYQPFPVQLEWDEIENCPIMGEDKLLDYMKSQGYDIRDTEKKILEQSRKTIFQKDLGIYSGFTEEIKKFLEALKTVDQVGNLYQKKVKKELQLFIFPKASKIYKEKVQIKKCRDELFNILVKFGYLVEDHPIRASGSESIRTSYSVGPHYEKALEDEFDRQQPYLIETLELESV